MKEMGFVHKPPMAALFIFSAFMLLVSSSHGCELDTNELRNNVTGHLYYIERELKVLVKEEQKFYGLYEFDQVHGILHQFLLSKYQDAENRLERLIRHLSLVSETNLTSTVYIPEEVISFSKESLIHSKKADLLIQQLLKCHDKIVLSSPKKPTILSSPKKPSGCSIDGTQCQYTACAKDNKLGTCAVGFATGVTGGAAGPYYTVTRPDDNNPGNPAKGTLRYGVEYAATHKGGAWIVFKENMVIYLNEKLWIYSDTTIDGRGFNVTIVHKGLVIAKARNVILHNLEVVSVGQSDTIHVFDGSRLVWIDHITSKDANLGLVTVLGAATDVTISNCFLSNHNFNMLIGASDKDTQDQILRVTVYRNWFESSKQRMPHCRWGYCHVANNYYRDWRYYAIGGRAHAKIFSELNVFEPGSKLEVTPWHQHFSADLTPTIQSSKDLLLKGATFHQFLAYGTLTSPESEYPSYNLPLRPTNTIASLVSRCSGVMIGDSLNNCMATR